MALTITITGPRAVGKSTLAHDLGRYLKERGHAVVFSNTVGAASCPFDALPPRTVRIQEHHP